MHEGLEGHGEHGGGAHDPFTTRVSLSISVIAVILALTTMMGHRAASEGSQKQAEAFDQWAFYQAKSIREHGVRNMLSLQSVITTVDKEKSEKLKEDSEKEIAKYEKDKEEIGEKAREFQKERDLLQRKVDKYESGESLLEIALVLCSVTLITRRPTLWAIGLAVAAGGLYFGIAGYLLH
ncbi:MAG TPA: DUF4337 domain-containing protein [Candidatus Acidoferrum sp.]|nr:DUF4337 domain-containing protein [Candidatus Acidoferrum sp.]